MAEQEKPESKTFNAKFLDRGAGLMLLTVPLECEVDSTVNIPGVNKFGNPYGDYHIIHVFNPGEKAMDKTAVGVKVKVATDKPRSSASNATLALQLKIDENAAKQAEANAVMMGALAKLMEKLG